MIGLKAGDTIDGHRIYGIDHASEKAGEETLFIWFRSWPFGGAGFGMLDGKPESTADCIAEQLLAEYLEVT